MSILTTLFGPKTVPAPAPAPKTKPYCTSEDVIRAILVRLPHVERLTLLKLTYVVQVVHLGRHGERVFPEWFKATTMGVYDAGLSQTCRYRISRRSYDARNDLRPILTPSVEAVVVEVCDAFSHASAGAVGAYLTKPGTAWERLWIPDPASSVSISDPHRFKTHRKPTDRGPVIGFDDMMSDFRMFTAPEVVAPERIAA